MWPFNKKAGDAVEEPIEFTSVLCIPGQWKSVEEVKRSVVATNIGEYIVAGNIMLHLKSNTPYTFEVCERDDRMRESFDFAGRVTGVTENFLNEIENHTYVVYLSAVTGNLNAAEGIAHSGCAVMKAGGIGIKVETAGKPFEKETWFRFFDKFDPSNLYQMFVIDCITEPDGTVFSCGMQNLGLKDTIVSNLPFQEAVDLIRSFSFYQLIDKPKIKNNQTFSVEVDAPIYRITHEPDQPYKGDKLFGNPFGMWRLITA